MTKRYLIKTTCEATEENVNFKGEVETYFYGKENESIKDSKPYAFFARAFGYKRLCDAKRVLKSHKETDDWQTKQGFWNTNSEIIEYTLCD